MTFTLLTYLSELFVHESLKVEKVNEVEHSLKNESNWKRFFISCMIVWTQTQNVLISCESN